MAMEMHVLFRGPLPSKAALARSMKELGFPLTITSKGPLEQQSGFMPMRLQREETGVEFDLFDGRDTVEELAGKEVEASLDRVASFRWGGNEQEMLCAMCTAAALTKLTGGLVFEEAEGQLMAADEAARYAAQHLATVLNPPVKRRGTRPADLKHYLKPLLKERSDLLFLAKKRFLVIRPIRHILRGAVFVPVGNIAFTLYGFVAPLHVGDRLTADMMKRAAKVMWHVWEPHLQPLLMNALAEDVFPRAAPVTTLSELGAAIDCSDARLLGGDSDRMSDRLRFVRTEGLPDWQTCQRDPLTRGLADVCRQFHDKEAAAAKDLGLGKAWEPSPFPVELPMTERHRVAEVPFARQPWIETPAGLLADAPEQCGIVRFSKDVIERGDRFILAAPLDREEAEARYQDREPYTLTTRLPDGTLLVLQNDGGYDKNDPNRSDPPLSYPRRFSLELYGHLHRLRMDGGEDRDCEGLTYLHSCRVHEQGTGKEVWHMNVSYDTGEMRAWNTSGLTFKRELTDADLEMITAPTPALGEYEGLVARSFAWLRATGFDDLL